MTLIERLRTKFFVTVSIDRVEDTMTLIERLEAIRTKFFDTQTTILLKRGRNGDTGGDMRAIAELERHRETLQEAIQLITQ